MKGLIEDLIIQDKIQEAFSELKSLTHDNSNHVSFINLWASFKKNEKSFKVEGIIDYDEYTKHTNRIRLGFISLVDEIFSTTGENHLMATYFMKLGEDQIDKSNYEKAIEYFEKVIELYPSHVQALFDRGLSYLNLGKTIESLLDFEKVLQVEPNNPFALNNRGVAYLQIGNQIKACEDWKRVKYLGFEISEVALESFCH